MKLLASFTCRDYYIHWICETSRSCVQLKENHVSPGSHLPSALDVHTPGSSLSHLSFSWSDPELPSSSVLPLLSHHHFALNTVTSDRDTLLSIVHGKLRIHSSKSELGDRFLQEVFQNALDTLETTRSFFLCHSGGHMWESGMLLHFTKLQFVTCKIGLISPLNTDWH